MVAHGPSRPRGYCVGATDTAAVRDCCGRGGEAPERGVIDASKFPHLDVSLECHMARKRH